MADARRFRWLDDVLRLNVGDSPARVGAYLFARADRTTLKCDPSQRAIARGCNKGVRAVQIAITKLVKNGVLSVELNAGRACGGDYRHRTNVYTLLPRDVRGADTCAPKDANGRSVRGAEPCAPKTVKGRRLRGADQGAQNCAHRTDQYSEQTSLSSEVATPPSAPICSGQLRERFSVWKKHCEGRGQPLTDMTAALQLRQLTDAGESEALAAIDTAIAGGYTRFSPNLGQPVQRSTVNGQDRRTASERELVCAKEGHDTDNGLYSACRRCHKIVGESKIRYPDPLAKLRLAKVGVA